ncbi:MAG TPA: hypothetical protein VFM04_04725 [Candidatus Methylomirabilis sp.]|nr:hypothetical protein [Candidatus Methylomirabilis sp.]
MRKVIVLLVSILTALAVGLGPVWPTPAEKADLAQVFAAVATEPTPEAFPKNLTGEVVSVEKGRRTMTVKESGLFTSKEVTFAVAEPVVPMLAELQPGDLVRVGYVEAHGQLIARAITKILAEPEKVGRSH